MNVAATIRNFLPASATAAWRRLAERLLGLLVFFAPLGTRLIWRPGTLLGHAVEWGTMSVYLTQILAAAFVFVTVLARPRWPRRLAASVGVFTVAVIAACTAASDPTAAWFGAGWWLVLGAAVFLAAVALHPDVRLLWYAFVSSAAVQAGLGLWQFFAQEVNSSKWLGMAAQAPVTAGVSVVETVTGRWLRSYGTLPHPNVFGIYCAVAAVVGVILAVRERGWRRFLALAATLLMTNGLVISFSRAAWIALAGGLLAFIVAENFQHPNRRRALAVALAPVFLAVSVAVISTPEVFFARLAAVGRLEQASVTERISSIEDGVAVLTRQLSFGAGPGGSAAAVAALHPEREWWQAAPPHFLPLAVAAEVGLVGLVAWLSVMAFAVRRLFRPQVDPDAAVFAAVVLFAVLGGLLDHYFWTIWPGVLFFWLILAMAAASFRGKKMPLP